MGKKFYGQSTNKTDAKHAANFKAANYRKAACYTPAKDRDCKKLNNGDWQCMAKAHHHSGSCGRNERRTKGNNLDSTEVVEEYTDATPEDLAEIEKRIEQEFI